MSASRARSSEKSKVPKTNRINGAPIVRPAMGRLSRPGMVERNNWRGVSGVPDTQATRDANATTIKVEDSYPLTDNTGTRLVIYIGTRTDGQAIYYFDLRIEIIAQASVHEYLTES